jgi:hypothetical protein
MIRRRRLTAGSKRLILFHIVDMGVRVYTIVGQMPHPQGAYSEIAAGSSVEVASLLGAPFSISAVIIGEGYRGTIHASPKRRTSELLPGYRTRLTRVIYLDFQLYDHNEAGEILGMQPEDHFTA